MNPVDPVSGMAQGLLTQYSTGLPCWTMATAA